MTTRTKSIFADRGNRRMSEVLREYCCNHPPAPVFFYVKECTNLYGDELDPESRCEFQGQLVYTYPLQHSRRGPVTMVYIFRDFTSGWKQRNTIGVVDESLEWDVRDRWWDVSSTGDDDGGGGYNFRQVASHHSNVILERRRPFAVEILCGKRKNRVHSLKAISLGRLSTSELVIIGDRSLFLFDSI